MRDSKNTRPFCELNTITIFAVYRPDARASGSSTSWTITSKIGPWNCLDLSTWKSILLGLTCFSRTREKLKTEFPNGTFSCEVPVEQSDGQPVHIQTQRLELVRLPGSYNFYSAEFVKGLQLTFGEWPTDVEFDVQVRPLGKGMDIKSGQKTCSCDALLLPGQGIEIRFFEKVIPAVQEAIV